MGFMSKLGKITGMNPSPADPYGTEDAANQVYPVAPELAQTYASSSGTAATTPAPSMELKMVSPTQFQEVAGIARELINQRGIILNTEQTAPEITRRMLDFLSGVAFCIGGQLQMIAPNSYIITPKRINVSGDSFQDAQKEQLQQQQQVKENLEQLHKLQQQLESQGYSVDLRQRDPNT